MSDHLTEEEARRLWERAARLQEEARRRAEDAQGALPLPADPSGGFALEHVRQAAVEAGIDATFVDAAWADVRVGVSPASPRVDRGITRFLGREVRELNAARVVRAPAAEVLEAVHDVFTSESCKLQLIDQVGGHPLDGGVLVFKASYDYTTPIGQAVMWSDMQHFLVGIRALDEDRTEVTVRCPMEHSRKVNFGVGAGITGFVSLGGGTMALLLGVAAGAAPPVAAAAALAGVAGSWFVGERGWRGVYGLGLRKGRTGLEDLLRQLATHVETRAQRRTSLPPA